ncbi:subtilisin-like protein [Colletotrichum sublineola]|nr:subtilisin-like protein [Colletotrichum sublineola]
MQASFIFFLLQLLLVAALTPEDWVYISLTVVPPPSHWKRDVRVPGDRIIHVDLVFSVDEARADKAAEALAGVSDPRSPTFGHYWNARDVVDLLAPPKESIREVARWLTSAGKESYVASETYLLPHGISKHIDFVVPGPGPALNHHVPEFVSVRSLDGLRPRETRKIDCFKYMAPDCLSQLYNFEDGADLKAHPENSLGFYTPSYSTWLAEDMDKFFADFAPYLVGKRPAMMRINGGYQQEDIKVPSFNMEPNLDYQYSMAMADPVPVANIQVGDNTTAANLNVMLAAFNKDYCKMALDPEFDPVSPNSTDCGTHQPPRVIGIAYAWNEAWYSDKYLHRNYTAEEGHFASVFPASCPWITTVGGTQFVPHNLTWAEGAKFPAETALDDNTTTSGGGFSRLSSAPWYQAGLTHEYLTGAKGALDLAKEGYFNAEGRGYPDISAMSLNYLVNLYGDYRAVKGTSTAVPLMASMFARINNERLHAGKATIGFVNPVLYGHRNQFVRDVEAGVNEGCGVDAAFPAARAWDAVTGLGSLDYAKLKDLYLRLP